MTSSAQTTANSGVSIFAVSLSMRRLIIAVVLFLVERRRRCGGLTRLLSQQVEIEYLPGHRRCGTRAETRVLHQHGERYFRVVRRCEGDEQRMVAQALGDVLLVVFLVLLQRHHLRGAGLAGAGVAG